MKISTVRLTACSLLLAAPLALTACGSSDSDSGSSPSTTQSSAAPSPQGVASGEPNPAAPSATSSSESPASEAPSSSTADPGEDSSGAAGKPSKADLAASITAFYDKQDDQYTKVLDTTKLGTCMADKSYDTMSAKSLNAMKDGRPEQMDPADANKLATYAGECGRVAAKVPTS